MSTVALIIWTLAGAGIGVAIARATGRGPQVSDIAGVMALGAVLGATLGWMLLEPAQLARLTDLVVAQTVGPPPGSR